MNGQPWLQTTSTINKQSKDWYKKNKIGKPWGNTVIVFCSNCLNCFYRLITSSTLTFSWFVIFYPKLSWNNPLFWSLINSASNSKQSIETHCLLHCINCHIFLLLLKQMCKKYEKKSSMLKQFTTVHFYFQSVTVYQDTSVDLFSGSFVTTTHCPSLTN